MWHRQESSRWLERRLRLITDAHSEFARAYGDEQLDELFDV